jgi:hypothetical protein
MTGLTRLKHLELTYIGSNVMELGTDDTLTPAALTGLKGLRLSYMPCEEGTSTAVVTELVRNLTQLDELVLRHCALQLDTAEGLDCLKAICHLTQLTWLDLSQDNGLTEEEIMQLMEMMQPSNDALGLLPAEAPDLIV